MEQRIQKLLSAVCSRRAAESLIAAGRVTVNGRPAVLGERADPARDEVLLDGKPLPRRERPVCLMLNKPRGYVTTLSDERGRRTVAELVASCGERVFPVGRLDMDSEGLLLLTNDGALANRLSHPRGRVEKVYEVTIPGAPPDAAERLAAVRDLDGEPIHPARVSLLRRRGDRAVLSVTIHQGKNRQIRRMCQQCGLAVASLRRVREHTLVLGGLKTGQWRYLTPAEIAELWEEA